MVVEKDFIKIKCMYNFVGKVYIEEKFVYWELVEVKFYFVE